MRIACGSTTWRMRCQRDRPDASAASTWPVGTERMPATTISQMKQAARLVSAMMPAVKASSSMPSSGRMKKIRKICTRNGVPRIRSTQAPITAR